MDYAAFLSNLEEAGWTIQGKSYAFKLIHNDWQVAFVRLGGRAQRSGFISFVICVRHLLNQNLDGEVSTTNKEPHSYPYKFTTEELRNNRYEYQCKLNNYELTYLESDSEWGEIQGLLENVVPRWLSHHSSAKLLNEIKRNGEGGYIENLWIEDLQNDA